MILFLPKKAGPKAIKNEPKKPIITPKILTKVGFSFKIKLAAMAFIRGTVAKIAIEAVAEVLDNPAKKKIPFKPDPNKPTKSIGKRSALFTFKRPFAKAKGKRIMNAKTFLKKAKENGGTSCKPCLVTTGPIPQTIAAKIKAETAKVLLDIFDDTGISNDCTTITILTKCTFKCTFRNMQVITTTQLRTKSKELVKVLQEGHSVDLIHRSKVVGEIKPKIYDPKPFDADKFLKIVKKLNFPKLTPKQIEARYRKAMMEKHGQSLS